MNFEFLYILFDHNSGNPMKISAKCILILPHLHSAALVASDQRGLGHPNLWLAVAWIATAGRCSVGTHLNLALAGLTHDCFVWSIVWPITEPHRCACWNIWAHWGRVIVASNTFDVAEDGGPTQQWDSQPMCKGGLSQTTLCTARFMFSAAMVGLINSRPPKSIVV